MLTKKQEEDQDRVIDLLIDMGESEQERLYHLTKVIAEMVDLHHYDKYQWRIDFTRAVTGDFSKRRGVNYLLQFSIPIYEKIKKLKL